MAVRDSRETYNEYMRVYHIERYHRLRKQAVESLGGRCVRCSSVEQLEIDHIDPDKKSFDAKMFLTVPLAVFWEEIQKCQILCKTCHTAKSANEIGRGLARGTHGTLSAYRYCGPPKCIECRRAKNEYAKNYRLTNGR